jgi:hypothetical protein
MHALRHSMAVMLWNQTSGNIGLAAGGDLSNAPSSPNSPGKTPFARFIKVRDVRRAGAPGDGLFYLDLVVGAFVHRGAYYDANKGQLQLSTCRLETRRPKLNRAYYVATVRPIIIEAIEKWVGEQRGKPYRFPKAARFAPVARKPRKPRQVAA